MKRFVEGEDRRQVDTASRIAVTVIVSQDNPSGSSKSSLTNSISAPWALPGSLPVATGRPAYHPATLLMIYLYGYLEPHPV